MPSVVRILEQNRSKNRTENLKLRNENNLPQNRTAAISCWSKRQRQRLR